MAGDSMAKEHPPVAISTGWLMQDAAHVTQSGDAISKVGFAPRIYAVKPYAPPPTATSNPPTATKVPDEVRLYNAPRVQGVTVWPVDAEKTRPSHSSAWVQAPAPSSPDWYRATVPGTALTTLVNNHIYPEPTYGENNRPNIIPEILGRTSYWYRTEFLVPADYAGRQIWLNFEGINYIADVWVNGTKVGTIGGAFIRGVFNVTALVSSGTKGGAGGIDRAAAAPRRSVGKDDRQSARPQWRRSGRTAGTGRTDLRRLHRLGLGARRARSPDRHLASGDALGHRPGDPARTRTSQRICRCRAQTRPMCAIEVTRPQYIRRAADRRLCPASWETSLSARPPSRSAPIRLSLSNSIRRIRHSCVWPIQNSGGPMASASRICIPCT